MGRLLCRKGALVVPLVLALTATAAVPASASGASLTLAGFGERPAIAVDGGGTGHIVWNDAVAGGDDRLIYCRLPRGATACESLQTLAAPADDFAGPRALLGGGELILLTHRCCFLGPPRQQATFAFVSGDGGATFSAPRAIGNNGMGLHGSAIFGPGAGSVSTIGNDVDEFFQTMPLAATPPGVQERAQVDDDVPGPTGDTGDGSIALIDPLTPMVAFRSIQAGGTLTYYRVHSRSGAYNSSAAWLPSVALGPGDDPRLAGGTSGTYLLNRVGDPGSRRYVVRRYDEFTGAFPAVATSVSKRGDPIFAAFTQDGGGHLHAAWVDNGAENEPLLYRGSADGRRWSKKTRKLAIVRDNGFNVELGAGPDGGGWAVWTTESGGGAVKAAPFDPLGGGGGGGACVPTVTYGKVVADATPGCFEKKGDRYTAEGGVRINGLDLAPAGGAKLTIDKGKGTLVSAGKFLVKAGNVELDREKLEWNLPKGGGQLKDLAGNPATFDAAKAGAEFLRLPVSGYVTPSFTGGAGTDLPVNLQLPEPFSTLLGKKITGRTTLRLDNARGLILEGAELRADSIFLGIAEVRDLFLTYVDDPFLLRGGARILLPVVKSELETEFGLANGAFDYGRNVLEFLDPNNPVDPGLPVAGQLAFLRSIGFAVATDPTRIEGTVTATGGPSLNLFGDSYAAVKVDGTVRYEFTDPGVFSADGSGDLFNIPDVAGANVTFLTTGLLSLAASFTVPNVSFSPVRLTGTVDGDVSLKSGAFNLRGSGSAEGIDPIPGSVGVDVVVSNRAAAGCVEAFPLVVDPTEIPPEIEHISGGVAYVWDSGFELFAGCDLGPYGSVVTASEARIALRRGAPLGFAVGRRVPQVNLAIRGQGAPPTVTITGPNGDTVSSGASPGASATGTAGIVTQSDDDDTAYAALPSPAQGRWTIAPEAGSAPIAEVLKATGLKQPKVTARVRGGEGRKRVLRYTVRQIPGQKVSFFEVGHGTMAPLGKAKAKRGRIAFKPADGPAGERTIEAHVASYGLPRDVLDVTRYRAPSSKPGKPRGLRVRRRGSKALISWRRARNAKRYIVEARMRDGRVLAITTRKTRATIRKVPGIDGAKIRVAGLDAGNSHGKAARERLRPRPKRERRA